MIEKHKEKVIVKDQDVVDNVICNRCGKPVHTAKDMCGNIMFVDCINFQHVIMLRQRFSEPLDDFDLCEDCINEIIGEFKIPVKINKI
jgi:hypothetical protein